MWDLSLLFGIDTVSWYAEFALRSRVSMSATGSVIVMMVVSYLRPVSASVTRVPTCGDERMPDRFGCRDSSSRHPGLAAVRPLEREAELP